MRLLLVVLYFLGYAHTALAQKSLTIDVFTLGHFKRIHLYPNDQITFKLKGSSHKRTHTLMDMADSILYIETGEAIRLNQIKSIIIDRSNFVTRMLASGFRIAGAGYVAIDAFNNAKNGEVPIFKEQVLVVGASLFALGKIIHLANKQRIRPGKNRTMQILDLSLK